MKRLLVTLVVLAITGAAFAQDQPPKTPFYIVPTPNQLLVQELVDASVMPELRWPDFTDYRKHLRNFYEPRSLSLAWTSDGRPTPQALAVIARFKEADTKGINAVDYDAPRWDARIAALRPDDRAALARFDVALSATLMRYISDLHIGRINPRNVQFDLDIEHKKYYLPKLLAQISVAADVGTILDDIEPRYEGYRRLQTALAAYRRIAAEGDEKPLSANVGIKPGDTYADLPRLVRLLRRTGDLPEMVKLDSKRLVYDGVVLDAVRRFQKRHGLESGGTIGPRTFRELNVPFSQRVRQIQLALERWRWAPAEITAPPIVVNIPEFVLRALGDDETTQLEMNVVVGKAYRHETPVFHANMTYLVFHPYWNVPPSIQSKELVPKIEKDRSFIKRNGYEVVDDYTAETGATDITDDMLAKLRSGRLLIRQKPGPSNALGLVKFMFPNRNNVYLHSTPSQELFSRTRRDFSHGCIRVEDPVALAQWVLREKPEWTAEKIEGAMADGPQKSVSLPRPIPIFIVYTTVVVTSGGEIRFFEDIYGHDATLENALAAGYPYPA